MKRVGTVLDMGNNSTLMFNQPVKLDFISSGYCVNIMDKEGKTIQGDDYVLLAAEDVTIKGQRNEYREHQCHVEVLTSSEKMRKTKHPAKTSLTILLSSLLYMH